VRVFFEDGAGGRVETVLGEWDCVSCPANVIHGYENVGLEPAYLQVMLGKGRPDLMSYSDAGCRRRRDVAIEVARVDRRSVKRKEDGRLAHGRGRYVDDIRLPGTASRSRSCAARTRTRASRDRRGAALALARRARRARRSRRPELALACLR
jgi:hypothetical protein